MGSRPTTVAGCSILPPLVGSGQVASPQPDSAGIAIAHGASGSRGLARSAAAPAGNLRRAARQVSPARVCSTQAGQPACARAVCSCWRVGRPDAAAASCRPLNPGRSTLQCARPPTPRDGAACARCTGDVRVHTGARRTRPQGQLPPVWHSAVPPSVGCHAARPSRLWAALPRHRHSGAATPRGARRTWP